VFVADRIRIRRVFLAGDAAHVTDLFDRPTRGEVEMRAGLTSKRLDLGLLVDREHRGATGPPPRPSVRLPPAYFALKD
jgi:hypothetical protein